MTRIDLEESIAAKALGIEAPGGGFGAILADPPWAFKTWSGKTGTPHRTANDHYATVHHTDIARLPVRQIAARDCALFMWVVDSHIVEAIELAAAWGFAFKTRAFVWLKTTKTGTPKIGMGYWTRKQTEECLLFTRGKPRRLGKGVRQLITAPRREHSRKPDEIYDRIQALVAGPYLELFARQRWPGWSAFGNEVDRFSAPGSPSQVQDGRADAAGGDPDLPRRAPGDGHAEAAGPSGGARPDDRALPDPGDPPVAASPR